MIGNRRRVVLPALISGLFIVLALTPLSASDVDQDSLTLSDAQPTDRFGAVVAASSDTMAVGRSHRGVDTGVHVFDRRDTPGWIEVARFTRPDPLFGSALAIDGDWLAVAGTDVEGDPLCGVVHLYQRGDDIWDDAGLLEMDSCGADHRLGAELALSGGRLAATDGESIHLYEYDADEWALRTTIPIEAQIFAIAMSGDLLAVLWQTLDPGDTSKVSVYDLSGDPIGEPAVLSPDLVDLIPSCSDVDIDGTRVVIGCQWEHIYGAAYVYDRVEGEWVESTVLLPRNGQGDFVFFGFSVAVKGDEVLVGAPGWSEAPLVFVGHAYLFRLLDGSWEMVANYPGEAGPGTTESEFGLSVGIANPLLIGDPGYALQGMVALEEAPDGRFSDDEHSVHSDDINTIAAAGITQGCNPPLNTEFCPGDQVTRASMAAFLRRALKLPIPETDHFTDDDGSIFEDDINAIAEAGITTGCNPPANDHYCPDQVVSRETMAAFIRRGFDYPASDVDRFSDDDGSLFEEDIDAIAAAGITLGCDPPTNMLYCPADPVTRQQMASFLARALAAPK